MADIPDRNLPPYLLRTDPMEWEDIPLQVSLLTMEARAARETIFKLMEELSELRIRCRTSPSNQTT